MLIIQGRVKNSSEQVSMERTQAQERLLKHVHSSPYRGMLQKADIITKDVSPSCGDRVTFYLVVVKGRIENIKFTCEGSILGQATASILSEQALGKSFATILSWTIGQVIAWIGIEVGPTRQRTVKFMLEVLQKGIISYDESGKST